MKVTMKMCVRRRLKDRKSDERFLFGNSVLYKTKKNHIIFFSVQKSPFACLFGNLGQAISKKKVFGISDTPPYFLGWELFLLFILSSLASHYVLYT